MAPWALKMGVVDGSCTAFPIKWNPWCCFTTRPFSNSTVGQPPKTIDELVALAAKIQAAGIIPFAHTNAEWKGVNEWFVGEFWNHVAGPQKVYDALTGKTPWTDPAFASSMEILNDMQTKGWFMGGMDRYYTATADERLQAFADGKAAMDIEGTWAIEAIPTISVKIGHQSRLGLGAHALHFRRSDLRPWNWQFIRH